MLSASSQVIFHPTYVIRHSDGVAPPSAGSAPSGLTPTQIRHAYGFDRIAFGGLQDDGTGQTIAIIEAYDSPTISSDLHAFDLQFGLPDPPNFTRVAQDGTTNYPPTDPAGAGNNSWELETSLDVEWAHALAPGANILLVEANSGSTSDLLMAAVAEAKSWPGLPANGKSPAVFPTSVISMSFGGAETSGDPSVNTLFTTPSGHLGITFLSSTGDSGVPAAYPAFSPNVVAVGGTTLSVDASGNYLSETGWSGSGGGVSAVESQPSYQNGVVNQFSTTNRTAPDVAFASEPSVAIYDSWDYGTATPWSQTAGTSLAVPCWAALIIDADQARVAASETTLDGPTQTLPMLYSLPSSDFNDIISGNNGFSAGPGYDLVTGRGSPKAPLVVSDLVGAFVSSSPADRSTVSTPPTDFTIAFTQAYDPNSIVPSDLMVNGIPADSVTLTNSTSVTFHYNTTPVTTQGLQSMSVAAGSITWESDGSPLPAFSASFRYDVLPISVVSTTPSDGSAITLPLTTLSVHFNEAYAASSISTTNLTLSRGSVSGFTLLDSQTVVYDLTGLNSSGALAINMAAGAVTDVYGNPGPAYSSSLILNNPPISFPTPLAAVTPAGSLIYQNSKSGSIAIGSTDTYTLALAAQQTLTLLVTPAGGLQAQLTLTGPGVSISASSASAGASAILQTVAINAAGTYTFTVNGLQSSIGSYSVQALLNAALSTATVGGLTNHSLATAQNIDPSFVVLNGTAQRGAATGTLAGLVGPDGFGYSGVSITPQFDDISPAGASPTPNAPILVGVDDGSAQLTSSDLSGFAVKLYASTYGSVYVSSNGLLTFGSGTDLYSNSDLKSSPLLATIAPFWDDLVVTGSSQSGVYWQVQGSGGSQRLVVQWNDVSFTGGAPTGQVTFEAILNADGTIIFNYKNLNGDASTAGGASATIGVKDAGTQGNHRLLVSYNSASSPYVAAGASLEIGIGLASPAIDYFAYTLTAGQSTTLAVARQNSTAVSVSLRDAQGTTLATGASPGNGSNVNSAISNFNAPSAGTYYAVVTGAAGSSYSLVVNRDADFGTQTNGSFSTAQNIGGTKGALGDLLAAPAAPTENWYSLNVTAGSAILLQTFTPGSASGQFVNSLVSRIQLYSPADALVASGQGSGNQTLSATVATTGLYRIRVFGNNSTSGEYFLSTAIDATPPTASIAAVSPSPRNTPVSQIQFVFNEAVSGVSLASLSLSNNGGPNLLTSSQTVTTSDNVNYTLGNLSLVTNVNGTYTLSLGASPNITDSSGGFLATGATTTFIVDMTPPIVAITPVSPNPSVTPIAQMQIVFSEPVVGFTLAALSLTDNGNPNLFSAAQALTTSDGETYTLGNLAGLTNSPGTYVLTLNAGGSGISDLAGNALAESASTSFVVNVPVYVTNVSDSGPGSLRQALLDAAGAPGLPHTVQFELPAGPQMINLLSPLPVLADPLVAVLDLTQVVTISSSSNSTWDNYAELTKIGGGTLTLGDANSFSGTIAVQDGSLRLNNPTTPIFTAGVGAVVTGNGTLDIVGSVSALTRAVNISNSSTAGIGLQVSGTNQVVGSIGGTGNVTVDAGSDLTVYRIIQGALVIGGTPVDPATVTISATNADGNPMVGEAAARIAGSPNNGAIVTNGSSATAGIARILADRLWARPTTLLVQPVAPNSLAIRGRVDPVASVADGMNSSAASLPFMQTIKAPQSMSPMATKDQITTIASSFVPKDALAENLLDRTVKELPYVSFDRVSPLIIVAQMLTSQWTGLGPYRPSTVSPTSDTSIPDLISPLFAAATIVVDAVAAGDYPRAGAACTDAGDPNAARAVRDGIFADNDDLIAGIDESLLTLLVNDIS